MASRVYRIQKNQRIFLICIDHSPKPPILQFTYETPEPKTSIARNQIHRTDGVALHQAGMVSGAVDFFNDAG